MTTDAPGDPYLSEHIRNAIAQDPDVNELGIAVAVVGTRVFVTGTVATVERRDRIAALIAERFPELEVRNDVTVPQVGGRPVRETIG
jgi:osmotically-inducible protein OsmY